MRIPGVPDPGLPKLAKAAVREFFEQDMLTYAAALAYHTFFALFPFLVFLIALLSFLELQSLFDWLLEQASRVLPNEAVGRVEAVLGEVHEGEHGGLLSLGIVAAIWTASSGMRATMNALNDAYDVREDRSFLRRYLLSIGFTVAFAALVVIATALMVVGPRVASTIAQLVGLDQAVLWVWNWLRIPVAGLLIMLAVSLVYTFAPNLEQRFRLLSPGAVVAVLIWGAAAWAFSIYVTNFARFSVTYGSVGAVIVLLLYIYISAAVLLLGAELNGEVRRATSPPPDQGPGSEYCVSPPRIRPAGGRSTYPGAPKPENRSRDEGRDV